MNAATARWIIWISDEHLTGWGCSKCDWALELPALLTNPQAKSAFDRLASAKFKVRICSDHNLRTSALEDSFAERARKLVMQGFNVKEAAEITVQKIKFENHDDATVTEQAHRDAADFLRRAKGGIDLNRRTAGLKPIHLTTANVESRLGAR